MIQRIQSVYLLLAALVCLSCLCLQVGTFQLADGTVTKEFNLWLLQANGTRNFIVAPLFAILVPTVALTIYTIFLYGNRRIQMRFATFGILLLVCWHIVYGAFALTIPADSFSIEWPAFLPVVAIIFCIMARRGIRHDEKLVRAADRIR